jgi:hypothetical protein
MTLDDAIAATQQPDWLNPLFALLNARDRDTPARTWWHADAMHDAIFRALKIAKQDEGAIFAAAPFRLHRGPDGVRILAAFPAPRILAPHDNDDWLEIETVLSWNPVTNTAQVVGDPAPALVGAIPPDTATLQVYGSPFAFFRALVEARAQWFVSWCNIGGDWRRKPREPDLCPGLLLLGPADKVTWPRHRMPEDIACHNVDPKALNRALIRQARVPRATQARTQ